MASPSLLESVYERATSFGRDAFQYIVTGTLFAAVGSVPWWSDIPWEEVRGSGQIVVLLVVAIVLFGLGHVLSAIGFCIRNEIIRSGDSWRVRLWRLVFLWPGGSRVVDEYNAAVIRTRQALPVTMLIGDDPAANVHVGLEMSVILKQPRLHADFIERYNTLWHLRLGLAASFLVAGFVNWAVFAVCWFEVTTCCRDQRLAVIGGVGLVSILLGRLLTRQHLVTNRNFLHRVMIAFNISEQADR